MTRRWKCVPCGVLWNGDDAVCWNCGQSVEEPSYPTVDGTQMAYSVYPVAFVPGQEW
jgi:hypothetical protein